MKKMSKQTQFCCLIALGLLILQVGVICFFNLTQLQNHIGFDTSTYYYTAMNMWEQKSIFLKEWVYQTTLNIDSSAPLAALFYGITGNIFISYGISNIIFTFILLFLFKKLMDRFNISLVSQLICLNLVVLLRFGHYYSNTNSLVYGDILFLNNAAYNIKTILAILIVICIIDMTNKKYHKVILTITALLCFISGISSGYWIAVTIIAPLLLLLLIQTIISRNWRSIIKNKIFYYLIVLGILSFIGKLIATLVLHFESKDSSMSLITLQGFWKNIGSFLLGYFNLLTAFPDTQIISALSINGIYYLINLFFAILVVVVVILEIKKKTFVKNYKSQILVAIILGDLFIFSLIDTTYSTAFFESRYLVVIYLFALIFLGKFYDKIYIKFNQVVIICSTVILLLISNVRSDYTYYAQRNNYHELVQISEEVGKYQNPCVYIFGDSLMETTKNLRVVDSSKTYKTVVNVMAVIQWGDTKKYDDTMGYDGKTLILTTPENFELLPSSIKDDAVQLEFNIDGYYLLEVNGNPFFVPAHARQ